MNFFSKEWKTLKGWERERERERERLGGSSRKVTDNKTVMENNLPKIPK